MMDTGCSAGVPLLMDYLEGVLPADVKAALDEHVAGCERCVAFIASYRETPRILRDATAAGLTAELEASLQSFLRARTTAYRGGQP
jgi:anti-sigma factor RsiW